MKKDPHLGSPAEEEGNTADTLRHPGPVAGVVEGRAAAINGFHVLCRTTASTSGLLRKQILVEDLAVEDGRRPGRLSVGAGRCQQVEDGAAKVFPELQCGVKEEEQGQQVGPGAQQGDDRQLLLLAAGEPQQVDGQDTGQ